MKIVKLATVVGLVSLSAVVWAEGQNASAPQGAMPAMMQPMHAKMHTKMHEKMQQTMRTHMQQIVNAKTRAQRQKLADQFMRTMPAQCGEQMGAGMMGSGPSMMGGSPMMGNGAPMQAKPEQGTADDPAHLQHHPADASQ